MTGSPGPGGAGRHWLWYLVGAAVLTQTALNLVRPVTSYLLLELGADAGVIGLTTAAYALLPVVAVMWLGRLAERTRRLSRLMLAAGAVLAAGCALLGLAASIPVVVLASVVLGCGHLLFTIAGQSSVARYSPPEALDRGFGWFTAAFAFGQFAGPLLGGLLLGSALAPGERLEHIAGAMWLGAGLSLLMVPLMIPLLRAQRPRRGAGSDAGASAATAGAGPERAAGQEKPTAWRILRRPGIPSHMAASLALLAMADLLIAFLPLVGEERGVSPMWVGVLLAIRAGASIVSRVLLGWLVARLGRPLLVTLSLLGAGTAFVLVPPMLAQLIVAAVLMAIGGFFLGLGQPLTMTLVTKDVPGSWRSAALALRLMGNRVGQVVLPLAAGALAAPLGPAGAIWFGCGLLAICGTEKLLRR
ncbi:MFS transporter [Sediminivirga luteola]|uniref:MFS transporter n=1 Tax=Sediminivirga luteola TaxID=1774748 RepID=A0A8J2TXL8_9MICO|nr:MFS transporter [Sediminivirga luteola]GGA13234.1 MFS transporter [Sediminivirga luteola]